MNNLKKSIRNLEDFDVVLVTALQEFRNWLTPWAMEAMHMVALEMRLLDGWVVYAPHGCSLACSRQIRS
jgi:hypothetical protein